MATINYTWTALSDTPGNPIHTIIWTPMAGASSDVGQPFAAAFLADKTVQLIGTLGTFLLQGCNEDTPVNWFTLRDASHTAINETGGARGEQILENPKWIRPNTTGAASGVTVILVGRLAKV